MKQIRYAGSPLKYSISEEHHNKGFFIVEMDGEGNVTVEKQELNQNTICEQLKERLKKFCYIQ